MSSVKLVGLDSNILIRFFTDDQKSEKQRGIAASLLESLSEENKGFVSETTFVEIQFSLSRGYKQPKSTVINTMKWLLNCREIVVESEDKIGRAVKLYETKKPRFNDCLIAIKNKDAGCEKTYSFDKDAIRDLEFVEP